MFFPAAPCAPDSVAGGAPEVAAAGAGGLPPSAGRPHAAVLAGRRSGQVGAGRAGGGGGRQCNSHACKARRLCRSTLPGGCVLHAQGWALWLLEQLICWYGGSAQLHTPAAPVVRLFTAPALCMPAHNVTPALCHRCCRPDAARVATDLLAFADTLVKQRAASLPPPDRVLAKRASSLPQPGTVLERPASVPQFAAAPAGQRASSPFEQPGAAATSGQHSGRLSQQDSTAAVAGSYPSSAGEPIPQPGGAAHN